MIVIRKKVEMSEEGVAIFWQVEMPHTPHEGFEEVTAVWICEAWTDALHVAAGIVAQIENRFVQLSAYHWTALVPEIEGTEGGWGLGYICYPCSEAHGNERITTDPYKHLEFHKRRLGPRRSAFYNTDGISR